MSDAQPAQIVMRSPELAHANVVVNERDRPAFEAKGYEYAGPHRAGEPDPASAAPAPSGAPAQLDSPDAPAATEQPAPPEEPLDQPATKGAKATKTK